MTHINPIELVGQLPLEQLHPLDNVSMWLNECGLSEFMHTFKAAGYDDLNLIKILNEEDLDAMDIKKPGTRKKILFYAEQLTQIGHCHSSPPVTPEPRPVASPAAASPRPKKKGNSRANPYRCTKCCEYKIRSLDGKAHQCNPKLLGHSWNQCPTQNIRQHPEERQRRKQNQKQKSKSRKRKGTTQSSEELSSPADSRDHSPEPITPWNSVHSTGDLYSSDPDGKFFVFEGHEHLHKRMKTADISQQVADVSVAVMENYMSDELAKQLGSHVGMSQEELRHHHIDFD